MTLLFDNLPQPSAASCEPPTPTSTPVPPHHSSATFRWVTAATSTHRRRTAETVYDCVRLVFVRDESIILTGTAGFQSASTGDVVMVAPGVPFGYAPEGLATVTTVLLDADYLLGVFFWQHLEHAADLADAAELAARMYPDPIQILRLGEPAVDRLGPVPDDLAALTAEQPDVGEFFRLQSLVDELLAAIAPHVRTAPGVEWPVPLGPRAGVPRWRVFHPAPLLVTETAAMMRANLGKRWRLAELAEHACFSTSQYQRVFHYAYGVSPYTYLRLLRVREMARLLRETDMPVLRVYERVGWGARSHAAVVFRDYFGTTPSGYRRYGPATASAGGPGLAVGTAHEADLTD